MKKKEFDRDLKSVNKLTDFLNSVEKKLISEEDNLIVTNINNLILEIEKEWTEVDNLENNLKLKKKELSVLIKNFEINVKKAEKVKKQVRVKLKDELKLDSKSKESKKTEELIVEPIVEVKIETSTSSPIEQDLSLENSNLEKKKEKKAKSK